MMRAFRILSLAAVLAAGSAVSAMAVEVDFGALTPSPGGCSHSGTDLGYVCTSPQTFSASGATFTATGFNNPFAPGGNLTFKPENGSPLAPPGNPFQESGIGHNLTAPVSPCSDPDCEIAQTRGVAISASQLMNDAIIGSVQPGETFNFFTGPSIAGLVQLGGPITGGSCTPAPGFADTCLINFPNAAVIAVEQDNAGDVLISAVSGNFTTSAPEPASLALLGSGLIAFGIFRRRRSM